MIRDKLFYRIHYPREVNESRSKFLPREGTSEFEAIAQWEQEKCLNGVTLPNIKFKDGTVKDLHIPGRLYYFLNHHYIGFDTELPDGTIDVKISLPNLRDIDWIWHTYYAECIKENVGMVIGGTRQLGKSEFIVAMAMYDLMFKQNAEGLALFSTAADKQTFTKKLDIALKNNTDFLTIPSLDNDFSKTLIRFGVKQTSNEDIINSKLYIYLTEEGNNTEVAAGKTPTFYIIDEIAKYKFLRVNEAVIPAIRSTLAGKTRLRCSPIYLFTGGNVERGQDAKKMFNNPKAYHCKEFDEDKTGLFMPGEYRSDFKKPVLFQDYLGCDLSGTELKDFIILATDFEFAKQVLDQEEADAKKESLQAYNARKMYAPRKKSDMFMSGKENPFAHLYSDFERHLHYLERNKSAIKTIELNYKDSVLYEEPSQKPILEEYPASNLEAWQTDTAICTLVEKPAIQWGTKFYVAGADPFNVNKTDSSASLGSIYIMQREVADYTDPFNERIVAWWNGRVNLKHMKETFMKLLLHYGAATGGVTLLHEAADDNLTQWFDEQSKIHFLEDTYTLAREINPNTKAYNVKGLKPVKKNQDYYISKIVEYCEEELPDGRLGLYRIPDPYLIRQLMNYEGDLGPLDAVVAFGHCLTHLYKERKYTLQKPPEEEEKEKKQYYGQSAFGSGIKGKSYKSVLM